MPASIGTRDFNPGWHTALDLKNLLTVSEAITRSGDRAKESRGAQFREDYPEKSAEFAQGEHGGLERRERPRCKFAATRFQKCGRI